MGLTACPACKAEVSSKASACPKCGHPLKRRPIDSGTGCLIVLVLLGVALAVLAGAFLR